MRGNLLSYFIGGSALLLGYILGLFAFAQIWLPIVHSLPRLFVLNAHKRLKRSLGYLMAYTLITPIIWLAISSALIWAANEYVFQYSRAFYVGLAIGSVHCLIGARRRDLESDFEGSYGKFIKHKEAD